MNSHALKRKEVYENVQDFWHDLYDTEYALLDVKIESKKKIANIRTATDRIGHIFFKMAFLLRQLDDQTLLQLGFPRQTLSFIRFKQIPFETVIARIDLVVLNNEIKLLELNSDTPTFIKETFHVNQFICNELFCDNPNHLLEKQLSYSIHQAILSSLQSIGAPENGKVVFTSHGDHEEDYYKTLALMEICQIEAEYVPLHHLKIVPENISKDGKVVLEKGVYTANNEKIAVLYRQTYPIEHLVDDKDPDTDEQVGEMLLKLVEEKQVAILNPPSSFLLQSKAIMAIIWGLHEQNHEYYSKEEHEWIQAYFLPTYLDAEPFLEKEEAFVRKPSFGREGDTIEIYSGDGTKQLEDQNKTYNQSLSVYQKYIDLPECSVKTVEGEKLFRYMYGCFLLNGKSAAIGVRVGGQITNNASYFLPVGIEKGGKS